MTQKRLPRKRGMIESVNDIPKTVCAIEHSIHRSPDNAVLNSADVFIVGRHIR